VSSWAHELRLLISVVAALGRRTGSMTRRSRPQSRHPSMPADLRGDAVAVGAPRDRTQRRVSL
jgi:hypothetical protein